MDKKLRYEISVGLFVIAAALVLGYMSLKISHVRVRDGIDVDFLFSHSCGLTNGAPVAVAGVEAGYVTGLSLRDGKALISTRIERSAGLRRDSSATIRLKSLLGEPYLELTQGRGGSPLLEDGDTVTNTVTPVQIDQMIAWLGRVSEKIEPSRAAAFLNALAEDPAATGRIIKNADSLLAGLSSIDEAEMKEFIQQLRIRARLF